MIESLISSKVRRALLEFLIAHPERRFHLRGLARELGLAVSPLRRELKRLEELGLLRAFDEGNMRLYLVDRACELFHQLERALQPDPAVAEGTPGPSPLVPAAAAAAPTEAVAFEPVPAVVAPAMAAGVTDAAVPRRVGIRTLMGWTLVLGMLGMMLLIAGKSRQWVSAPSASLRGHRRGS
jgi:hypothetical protein